MTTATLARLALVVTTLLFLEGPSVANQAVEYKSSPVTHDLDLQGTALVATSRGGEGGKNSVQSALFRENDRLYREIYEELFELSVVDVDLLTRSGGDNSKAWGVGLEVTPTRKVFRNGIDSHRGQQDYKLSIVNAVDMRFTPRYWVDLGNNFYSEVASDIGVNLILVRQAQAYHLPGSDTELENDIISQFENVVRLEDSKEPYVTSGTSLENFFAGALSGFSLMRHERGQALTGRWLEPFRIPGRVIELTAEKLASSEFSVGDILSITYYIKLRPGVGIGTQIAGSKVSFQNGALFNITLRKERDDKVTLGWNIVTEMGPEIQFFRSTFRIGWLLNLKYTPVRLEKSSLDHWKLSRFFTYDLKNTESSAALDRALRFDLEPTMQALESGSVTHPFDFMEEQEETSSSRYRLWIPPIFRWDFVKRTGNGERVEVSGDRVNQYAYGSMHDSSRQMRRVGQNPYDIVERVSLSVHSDPEVTQSRLSEDYVLAGQYVYSSELAHPNEYNKALQKLAYMSGYRGVEEIPEQARGGTQPTTVSVDGGLYLPARFKKRNDDLGAKNVNIVMEYGFRKEKLARLDHLSEDALWARAGSLLLGDWREWASAEQADHWASQNVKSMTGGFNNQSVVEPSKKCDGRRILYSAQMNCWSIFSEAKTVINNIMEVSRARTPDRKVETILRLFSQPEVIGSPGRRILASHLLMFAVGGLREVDFSVQLEVEHLSEGRTHKSDNRPFGANPIYVGDYYRRGGVLPDMTQLQSTTGAFIRSAEIRQHENGILYYLVLRTREELEGVDSSVDPFNPFPFKMRAVIRESDTLGLSRSEHIVAQTISNVSSLKEEPPRDSHGGIYIFLLHPDFVKTFLESDFTPVLDVRFYRSQNGADEQEELVVITDKISIQRIEN